VTIDWDAYRFDYPALTDEQHIELYERVWRECPKQRSATVDLVRRFLGHDNAIVEIGAWDGWLWTETKSHVGPWLMLDVCPSALAAAQAAGGQTLLLKAFRWWRHIAPGGDALIACHIIEHLSDDDFTEMARAVFPAFREVYLEAPLPQQGPCDWAGYDGSHVMKMGWDGVRKVMADLGFVEQWAEKDSVAWRRA
jgi:hypothetical protein